MKLKESLEVIRWLLAVAALAAISSCERVDNSSPQSGSQPTLSAEAASATVPGPSYFTISTDGVLSRPKDYREWVYVGTPLTPNALNPPEAPFPEFHNVYIDPASWAHFKQTGEFRDGAILIKELVAVGANSAVSGNGYFMGEFVGLEAAIKSSRHFPDEPGYWAYFSFGHAYPLAETAEAFPTEACNACHSQSAMNDFVFTQYYPVLRTAATVPGRGSVVMNQQERVDLMDAMTDATAAIGTPRADTGKSVGPVPTDLDDLFDYLTAFKYLDFRERESALHPSRGPHADFGRPVRVFLDDTIAASLAAGNGSHPAGSSIIKEMYLKDGETLHGWAVMVKTQDDAANGDGWFWYEVLSTTDRTQLGGGQAGNGIPLCTGCHIVGKDFVLTTYPLK